MGKQAFPARGKLLPAPVSFRKKWREARVSVPMQTLPALAKKFKSMIAARALFTRNDCLVPPIVFLIFVVSHPYRGIVQDAYIYMGRTLADFDPKGVGRDLMFVHDGQFGFSVFRLIADAMVWCFGLAPAAKVLAILAAFAWFFGVRAFARQFASGAAVWVAVIFTVLLPNAYGAPYPFGFAELIAIPRPFAEALVLASLAAFAAGREGIAIAFIAAAALLHPIMALGGLAVLATVRGFEDRRWFWFCVFSGVLLILAGALGAPLLDRLFIPANPSLKSLLGQRSPFLFPGLWPIESFPPLIAQATAIAIAASFQQGRRQMILAAIIGVGLSGIAVTAIFGDWLSSFLIIQAQPWRMAWLMAAAGAMALGLCAAALWRDGPGGRIVLALLVLCWSFNTQFWVAGPAAILALVLHFRARRFAPALRPRLVACVWIFTIGVTAIWQLRLLAYPWQFAMAAPASYGNFQLVLVKGLLAYPLCALAVFFAIRKPRIDPLLQGSAAAFLLAAVLAIWDHRPPAQRMMEAIHRPPDLMRLIDQRQGEVLWIDGLAESWFFLARPQWASPLQGVPILFSPVLAAE